MKKVFGQTVRDLKREVNKTVLKVPRLEQKVLDATSNERWGPHGTLLADLAQATMNFKEYQMIMAVLWKRINDSGKNWRHVYKALAVLDYLVANGSERVVDEVKENAYQLSTLFNFQYIDSKGRDQGVNVRKKAQSLVNLVNDKERIIEVRQQAAANREKFYNPASSGEVSRPGGYGDRYDKNGYERRHDESRDEDKNGVVYGRERDYGYRDEDLDRDYANCRRSQSVDDFQHGSTDKSVDRDRVHASDEDGHSSRSSGVRFGDQSQDGKQVDKKLTEQDIGAPPSYEEALIQSQNPANDERETAAAPAPTTSGPSSTNSQSTCQSGPSAIVLKDEVEVCDEFDPRSVSAAPSTSKSADMDLLDSLSESLSNPLAIMPAAPVIPAIAFEPCATTNSGAAPTFSTSGPDFASEVYVNPFSDPPFKALPSSDVGSASTEAFNTSMKLSPEPNQGGMLGTDTVSNLFFGESFSTYTYPANSHPIVQSPPSNSHDSFSSNQDVDILAGILPPSQTPHSFSGYSTLPSFATVVGGYTPQMDSAIPNSQLPGPQPSSGRVPQSSENLNQHSFPTGAAGHLLPQAEASTDHLKTQSGFVGKLNNGLVIPNGGSGITVNPHMAPPMPGMPDSQPQPSSDLVPPSNGNLNWHSFPTGGAGNLSQAETRDGLQGESGPDGQFNNGILFPNGWSGIVVNPQMAPSMPGMPNSQLNSANSYNQMRGPEPSGGPSGNLNQHSFPTGVSGNMLAQAEASTDHLKAQSGLVGQLNNGMLLPNGGSGIAVNPQIAPSLPGMPNSQITSGSSYNQMVGPQPSVGPSSRNLNQHSFPESNTCLVSHHSLPPSTALRSALSNPPSKDKFQTKSTVWADTLSRGLINLNISGSETNSLADIGIDFDSLNRKEKRMEKPSQAPVASTITMGKAMGSGSGMGRVAAGALRPPPNPMMGPPGSTGGSMVMGGYGGMNPLGMGTAMNMNLGMSNMGSMGQQPMGIAQGANMSPMAMPVGYNPMMNNPQQPYGGAYSMMNTPQHSYGGGYQ